MAAQSGSPFSFAFECGTFSAGGFVQQKAAVNVSTSTSPHPRYRRLPAAAVICVAVALVSALPTPAAAATPTIAGTVVDPANAPQASVALDVMVAGTPDIVASTLTDNQGQFAVMVPSGIYDLLFTPTNPQLQPYTASGVDADVSAPLTVVLQPVALIHVEGTVGDSSGAIYANTEIAFTQSGGTASATLRTDANGHYATDLVVGQYRIGTSTPPGAPHPFSTSLSVAVLDHDQTFDVTVPLSTLTVLVRDSDGNPVTGVSVGFSRASGSVEIGSITYGSDATGWFRGSGENGEATFVLPTGVTLTGGTVVLDSGARIPFTAPQVIGQQTQVVVIPAEPEPMVHINGTLGDSAGAVYRNTEIAFRAPGTTRLAYTDTNGHYSLDLVRGAYTIASSTPPHTTNTFSFSTSSVNLDADQTLDITVPVSTLTVSVRDQNGNVVPGAGVGFASASGSADVNGVVYSSFASGWRVGTHPNGDAILAVPRGSALTGAYVVLDSGQRIPFTAATVDGDQTQHVTVSIEPVAHIDGTFGDSSGAVYPNTEVNFNRTDGNGGSRHTVTDASGHYSIDLAAGTYRVAATTRPPNLPYGTSISDVTFDHDRTFNVTIPLSTLTVSVREPDGSPVPQVSVGFGSAAGSVEIEGATYQNTAGPQMRGGGAPGDVEFVLPTGVSLHGAFLVFESGLRLSFVAPVLAGDRRLFLIVDSTTGVVLVDDTPPIVTGTPDRAANSDGWYNAPVTVTWSSLDPAPTSGAPTTPPSTVAATEGAQVSYVSGPSCDPASNCATGSLSLSIDSTPPAVAVTGVQDGHEYLAGQAPDVGCSTTDLLSGVAADASPTVTDNGSGSYTATCGGAVDRAGNSASTSVTYSTTAAVYGVATNTRSVSQNGQITATVASVPVPAGDTVTMVVATGTFAGAIGCSDTKGNAYVVATDINNANGRLFVCSAPVTHDLTNGDVITATYPVFSGLSVTSVNAIDSLATTGTVDVAHAGSGNNASPDSGTITTSDTPTLLFGFVAHNSTPTLTAPGPGYTVVGAVSGGSGSGRRSLTPEFKLVNAAGTYAATGTLSVGQQWRAAVVAYGSRSDAP